MTEKHWTDQALCKDFHGELWFPPSLDDRAVPESHYYEIAKMVCEQCPVQDQCRELGEEEEFGVWGGWSPKDRKRGEFRRRKKILPPENFHVLPKNDTPHFDIEELRETLKEYTKRRPRAKSK